MYKVTQPTSNRYANYFTCYQVAFGSEPQKNLSADKALTKLKQGNKRFMIEKSHHPHSGIDRVRQTSKSQHPFAAILSCSDSRVSPDIIFDQGLGDLFQVRNAGNILDKSTIGSLEYAVSHCGVNLIVIMGHDDCGAVKATMNKDKNKSIYLNKITHYIYPSLQQAQNLNLDIEHDAAEINCRHTATKLIEKSKIISDAVKNNGLKIIPAMYDTETGYVNFS